jgi:hypothetical protein
MKKPIKTPAKRAPRKARPVRGGVVQRDGLVLDEAAFLADVSRETPEPERAESCASCRMWQRLSVPGGGEVMLETDVGQCLRYPPGSDKGKHHRMLPSGAFVESPYPLPDADMWCGEYRGAPHVAVV